MRHVPPPPALFWSRFTRHVTHGGLRGRGPHRPLRMRPECLSPSPRVVASAGASPSVCVWGNSYLDCACALRAGAACPLLPPRGRMVRSGGTGP